MSLRLTFEEDTHANLAKYANDDSSLFWDRVKGNLDLHLPQALRTHVSCATTIGQTDTDADSGEGGDSSAFSLQRDKVDCANVVRGDARQSDNNFRNRSGTDERKVHFHKMVEVHCSFGDDNFHARIPLRDLQGYCRSLWHLHGQVTAFQNFVQVFAQYGSVESKEAGHAAPMKKTGNTPQTDVVAEADISPSHPSCHEIGNQEQTCLRGH